MRQKDSYTLEELYDNLAIAITELSEIAHMTEVTIRRIRYGFPTRRSTANKLLLAFSKAYERELSLENVIGFNLEDRRGPLTKGKDATEKAEKVRDLPDVRQAKVITEKAEKRAYKARETGLPQGCILASEFGLNHGVARETFRDHMTKGLGPGLIGMSTNTIPERDRVDYSERPKPGRESRGEKEKYLTQEQQHQALEFWKRHDVGFSECNDFGCWCHTVLKENK